MAPAIEKKVGIATSFLMEEMTQDLVYATPICTGYAGASWYVTPDNEKEGNDVKYLGDDVNCLHQYPKKTISVPRYNKIHSNWFIVNFANYIGFLNEGGSKQQDVGWIQDIVKKHSLKGLSL